MDNKYIGILTSGGDASGMNTAIRAVTRAAIFNGFKVKGIYRGYEGLIAGEVKELTTEDVSSIIQRGGTILKTARSETFTTPEGRKKAYKVIQKENINALIIIGGDGSLTGARIFAEEYNVTCIGLPGTIDNDLYGTDFTIGYDTALNTIVECVDKISNLETLYALYKEEGEKVWESFNKPKEEQKWYYTNMYDAVLMNTTEENKLFERYKKILDKLF